MQKTVLLFVIALSLTLAFTTEEIVSKVNSNPKSTWVAGHNEYFAGRTFE